VVERKDTMVYNSTTRSELFQNFLKSRQPGFTFGMRNKTVFQVLASPNYQLNAEENKIMQELFDELNTQKMTPGVFFRKKYFKVVEFCAGSKSCAEALCNYFDKLNKFPYSTGWDRRTVSIEDESSYLSLTKIQRQQKSSQRFCFSQKIQRSKILIF